MLNRVILIGRLAKNPEIRYTSSGIAVANFPLAVERPFTNQSGERDVDYLNIVAWRKMGETVAAQLSKGRLVAVEGRIQTRSYDDNQGVRRKAVDIVAENIRFLDWPKDGKKSGDSPDNNDAGGFGDDIDVPF